MVKSKFDRSLLIDQQIARTAHWLAYVLYLRQHNINVLLTVLINKATLSKSSHTTFIGYCIVTYSIEYTIYICKLC